MARRSRLKGKARVKRLFKALPDGMRRELIDALTTAGALLKAAMAARAPRRTGAVAAAIDYKVLPTSLRLRVGLLTTKRRGVNGSVRTTDEFPFYGRFQDLGVGAQIAKARRRGPFRTAFNRRTGKATGAPYDIKIAARPGKRFVTGSYPELRRTIQAKLKGIWARAVAVIAGGGDD